MSGEAHVVYDAFMAHESHWLSGHEIERLSRLATSALDSEGLLVTPETRAVVEAVKVWRRRRLDSEAIHAVLAAVDALEEVERG